MEQQTHSTLVKVIAFVFLKIKVKRKILSYNIGRMDANFHDHNQELIPELLKLYPDLKTLEMETGMLFALAHQSIEPLHVGACAMVFANRLSEAFIDKDAVPELELRAGRAILETLVSFQI